MFNRLEWMIAGRYLRARRKEGAISVISLISLIGIFLGVGTLIVVMSVMNGFRAELVQQILGAQPHVTLYRYPGTKGIEDYDALAERLREIPGVTRAAPRIEETVMATAPRTGESTGVKIRALRKEDVRSLPKIAEPEWSAGSLENFAEGVAVGEGVANRLGLGIGDQVTVVTPPNRDTPAGRIVTTRTYDVVYIFRSGFYQDDNAFFLLPLERAQSLANRRGRADGIEIGLADPEQVAPDNSDPLSQRLQAAAGGQAFPWNWKRAQGGFLSALDAERGAMFVILSLIILVAALNIVSGLIMLVKEKGQNIGIMRTFGVTRGAILRIFLICGMTIGVIGTILGVIGGVLFVIYIHDIQAALEALLGIPLWPVEQRGFSQIPTILDFGDVTNVAIVALILSAVATWYPARRAARMDPVEALRYE